MTRLPPQPELAWSEDGAPRARDFDDVYFSREGGLAEAEVVFLGGCDLPERWRDRGKFAVCELGFGTGLNVLALWRAWRRTRQPHAILHISSIEAYPLAMDDAARALRAFPEIEPFADLLLKHWPVRAYAPQRIWFPDDNLALTFHIGDAAKVLAGMEGQFDAWFLDGFAPSRNPGMWTEGVIQDIARLSAPDARLATFTVAGGVRRALAAAGFAAEKAPGFGSKRERLVARYGGEKRCPAPKAKPFPYWASAPKRLAILGAGIAGAACAAAAVRRGAEVVVFEQGPTAAFAASGNPAGLVAPRLDRGGGAAAELFLSAYIDAVRSYAAMGAEVFDPCGVEERPQSRAIAAFEALRADPPLPLEWFQSLSTGAALHVRAGTVRPRAAIERLLAGATLLTETAVAAIESDGAGWIVRAAGGRALLKADAILIACGAALTRFEATRFLPIALSRGQVEWGGGVHPDRGLMQGTYAAPLDGGALFGATFDAVADDRPPQPDAASRALNLAALAQLAPEMAAALDVSSLQSRAAHRATTNDRMPIAGSVPNATAWLNAFAALAQGRRPEAEPPFYSGLYVLGGLGARGLTLAPLLGERIASEMFGEPHALSRPTLDAIHPARFLLRKLKRA